ncbi:MAG: succinylglutamate desuccinylase/aspartoacylase family protein [Burkholderiaceae bacterium]|nr:succinylglutamate desuccinylase/aspartoacylase family protein [Burkholderiaceae bacterium]
MSTPTALHPFKSVSYSGRAPGTRLIVTGAVHGNEVCGTLAIRRLIDQIDRGELAIARGQLTLVPVTNPLAHAKGVRAGDRNLNRALGPAAIPREFEDHVANWLCPLLAAHQVLLDLHSFQSNGRPFVMVGPLDNRGPVEPFEQAAREEAWVRVLGVDRAVDGWLGTYAHGVARRQAEAAAAGLSGTLDLNPNYGVGTTEYMRAQGGCALTLECGQHQDPAAPEVAYRAIRHTLAHFGLTDEPAPAPVPQIEALSLHEVIDKRHANDRFARPWQSFDALAEGELIGTRADGTEVRAPRAGRIVFPNAVAQARNEWFYLAQPSGRF